MAGASAPRPLWEELGLTRCFDVECFESAHHFLEFSTEREEEIARIDSKLRMVHEPPNIERVRESLYQRTESCV